MEVLNQLTTLKDQYPRITVALGTFDGVHIGHQKVISRSVESAKQLNGTSVVFTFSNHPLSIIAPERCPLQIITQDDKVELIEKLGVDILLNIPFTAEFLKLSASQFIRLLLDQLNPKHILIGPNYFFGYKRCGTPKLLQKSGLQYGFTTEINPTVYVDDVMVSSTLIRQMIAAGQVHQAANLLGRPVTLKGMVIHGAKRGRLLGYPTINLGIASGLAVPQNGVYAVELIIQDNQYNGIANVGTNPTFHDIGRRIEVHILDFSGDLYGEAVTVRFLNHIRNEQTFSNSEELKLQIAKDIVAAQKYYQTSQGK
ncbi:MULTISPECIES: bifunctional riboflavin kinase/FAD synthetase [Pelosinus]|uniref:Riboflavin biosynthesis protein n=1 Tax=Pelosinus fermentans B4 TaxID=1149862 RepID=I9B060_9FIRM|nr:MULTISPECIES: bifunctional riboflavin kinase/FAD synthetase [Pelosinus]EIW18537.1 riboflavin biosynthesis protein RibF [Pelosinus fermentans B4]EIW24551.1 riboflavin biosynthesis protein RibF [Pelosinus fermentans A11]OAM94391.1 riboflavin biosynthesis protein RibF [Pelosinus fermentans DSM 17108]SDR07899.1 riboflavin kinase / FMN adenylyltransferase [Pelosinus fermentans]